MFCDFPANTQRRNNVAATSQRCSDAVTTLMQRCVFAGFSFSGVVISYTISHQLPKFLKTKKKKTKKNNKKK